MEDERYRQDGFGQYDELWDNSIMEQFEEEPIQITLPEKSKKGRKEMLSLLLIAAMVLSTAVWCLWSGMKGLFFAPVHPMEEVFTGMIKGEVYEGDIVYASKEYCSLKHTINLIPAGTEHFYLMYASEMDKVILIRAPKGWDKNFTNDAMNLVSERARGIVRKLDHEIQRKVVSNADSVKIQIETQLYLDLMGNKICYLQIFTGISLIFCSIFLVVFTKKERTADKEGQKKKFCEGIFIVFFFVTMILLVYLLNMTG